MLSISIYFNPSVSTIGMMSSESVKYASLVEESDKCEMCGMHCG